MPDTKPHVVKLGDEVYELQDWRRPMASTPEAKPMIERMMEAMDTYRVRCQWRDEWIIYGGDGMTVQRVAGEEETRAECRRLNLMEVLEELKRVNNHMIKAAQIEAERQGIALDEDSEPIYFAPIFAAMIDAIKEGK